MAVTNRPIINPIRLHQTDRVIDYVGELPNQDSMFLRNNYQRGIYATDDLYPNFAVGEQLAIQFSRNDAISVFGECKNLDTNHIESIVIGDRQNINGVRIWVWAWNITTTGRYRVTITIATEPYNVISDEFIAVDWANTKDLIKIEYTDSRNRYGGYFFSKSGSNVLPYWNPIAFYTGNITPITPNTDSSEYNNDSAGSLKLNEVNQRVSLLTLTDISRLYIDTIKTQAASDVFVVNGVDYTTSNFNVEDTPNSDLVDIKINLTQKENDYYAN